AVVANELALVGLGLGEVRVMDQRAGDLAARRARPALHRPAVLAEQEAILEPYVEVIPRQPRADRPRAEIRRDVDAVGGERALPAIDVEDLFPAVEPRAIAPHRFDHVAEPAVAAREHALDERHAGIVILEPQAHVATRAAPQQLLLALDLGQHVLRAP